MTKPMLGCIADDFTGGTDLAGMLVKAGMRTVQMLGVPRGRIPDDIDAVVIALKSRTNPAGEAMADSLAALERLRNAGCRQFYFKYCSTFDSTSSGNIGPVAEALMKALGTPFSIACPAFPVNGRTIYKGYLFVGDMLLSESGMRDHPLNPMTNPIAELAGKHSAVLPANHGPVVSGSSLEAAVYATEELEEAAKLFLLLRNTPTSPLNAEQIAELKTAFKLDI